jgi:hypothetical protein
MLGMKDPKKLSAVIVAKMKGDKEEMSDKPMTEDGAEMSPNLGLESAAEEIMSAVKSGDSKLLVDALKSFVEMCDYSEEESED